MAIRVWTNSAGGNWGGGLNWSGSEAPVAGDTADITNALVGLYTVAVTDDEAAGLVNIGNANATLVIEAGGVLTADAVQLTAGTLSVVSGAQISNATITDNAGTTVFTDGTLDNVTWRGTLGLDGVTQASLLTITGSLAVLDVTGTQPGAIDITGPGAELDIASSMTLDGSGGELPIDVGASASATEVLAIGSADILTLGSNVALAQTAAGSAVDIGNISIGGTLVNSGTMSFNAGPGASASISTDTFVNRGTISEQGSILNGESLLITVGNAFSLGATGIIEISNFGRVGITAPGSFDLEGNIGATGMSTLDLNTNATGSGTISLSAGSVADLFNFTGVVAFDDAGDDVLALEQPGSFTGTIVGLQAIPGFRDSIDLLRTAVTSLAPYSGDASGGVLTALDGDTPVATLNLTGNYVGAPFSFKPDGNGGNIIQIACFGTGTRIRTAAGEVPIELLRVGDLVVSAFGGVVPLQWIGRRRIDARRHRDPQSVWPIRFRAGSLSDGVPARDLYVSPEHAIYLGDLLVPARLLVNGIGIVHEPVAEITYWHLEFPQHDVVFAEAAMCESYLDTGNRADFENGGETKNLHPDFASDANAIWLAQACATQCRSGPKLDAIRKTLERRYPTTSTSGRSSPSDNSECQLPAAS